MIIWRYILRSLVGPFVFGTSTIMVLFLVQYIIRWIEDLASKGLGPLVIAEFIVLNLSWILVLAVPIGILFATLMAFGSMSAAHEVTIYKASGMGLFRMMVPVIAAGACLWGFVFWYTDNVLPDTNLRLSTLIRDVQRVKPTFAIEAGQFTTHLEGFTILARRTDTAGTLFDVTIYDRSRTDRVNIVNADSAKLGFSPSLTRLMMHLFNGEIHQRSDRKPNEYRVITFRAHQIAMPADRMFFEETDATGSSRSDREMRISDMQQVVDRAVRNRTTADHHLDSIVHSLVTGLTGAQTPPAAALPPPADTGAAVSRALARLNASHTAAESEAFRRKAEADTERRYDVEIYKKYTIPAACMLFVLVGCPLGILTRGGNFGISAAISLGFYVLYWASLIGGEKLADRGFLAPGLAMWLGNIVLTIIGFGVIVRVNYEMTPLEALRLMLRRRRQ